MGVLYSHLKLKPTAAFKPLFPYKKKHLTMHMWKAQGAPWIVCGCMCNFQPIVYKDDGSGSLPQSEHACGHSRPGVCPRTGPPH